jgi:hypothetical protein
MNGPLVSGQVVAERCLLTFEVDDSEHPIVVRTENLEDQRSAEAHLTLREAQRAMESLSDAISQVLDGDVRRMGQLGGSV